MTEVNLTIVATVNVKAKTREEVKAMLDDIEKDLDELGYRWCGSEGKGLRDFTTNYGKQKTIG